MLMMLVIVGMEGAILYKQSTAKLPVPAQQRSPVRDPAKGDTINISGIPTRGSTSAALALVEFSDYECPFCSRHALSVGIQLEEEYVKTGKMRVAFVNNPLPIHPNARIFARAAICAGEQNRYWEMHDMLFAEKPLGMDNVKAFSKKLKLGEPKFDACVNNSSEADSEIEKGIGLARAFQLTGTPAFAVGRLDSKGEVKIDKFILGAQPVSVFESVINSVLLKSSS